MSRAVSPSLRGLLEPVTVVAPTTTCGEIERSFRNRWTSSSIVVTAPDPGGHPGTVSRSRFLATMAGHRGYGRLQWDSRPIGELAQWAVPALARTASFAEAVALLGNDPESYHDLVVVDEAGRPCGIIRPVRLMQALADLAVQRAATDGLTGVASRGHLVALLGERLEDIARGTGAVVVAYLDLDRLKGVNDALGHSWGDALLRSVVRRIRARLRPTDCIGRLGGDEFAVVRSLRPYDAPDAACLALELGEDLCAAVAAEDPRLPSTAHSTASVGLAVATSADTSVDAVLHAADQAMYAAKQAGGGRACLAGTEVPRPGAWAEGRHLEVVYQPIVDIARHEMVAVEALLRQRNADGGLDGPGEALEEAERAGMSLDLDRWVLDRACRDMVVWREELGESAPGAMHVNLAADSLTHAGLVAVVLTTIDATGLPRGCVRLELSERAGVQDLTRALSRLEEIADAGVGIALDDLGASLDTLRVLDRLPIETIKLDRSVVVGASARAPIDLEVLSLVVRLARTFGLEIVGEGVEELTDETTLRCAGIALAQGFRYSHPIPADEIVAAVRADASLRVPEPRPPAEAIAPVGHCVTPESRAAEPLLDPGAIGGDDALATPRASTHAGATAIETAS